MNDVRDVQPDDRRQALAEQARKVRALYPELFAELDEGDRHIHRALSRIPHPSDPEALVPHAEVERSITALKRLGDGISGLCNEA